MALDEPGDGTRDQAPVGQAGAPIDEEAAMTCKKPRKWGDLTPRQQTAILVLGSVQLSLAATAWADLATRPASQVNGRKGVWAAVIAVNFLGPVLYFTCGVRRHP
jgi:hypothetical protein